MLKGLNHITLTVSDLDKSMAFYCQLLGFTGKVMWRTGAYLSLHDIWLCLSVGVPDIRQDYSHIAFSIDREDFSNFALKLESLSVKQWQQNSSEGSSLYFLDPDGHKLEVHVGGLEERLQSLRNVPYQDLKWL
ncbi:glutathione transferase [Marinomonas agarivorans]|nr:glutathione transferase [Marinomonas agarivorans]